MKRFSIEYETEGWIFKQMVFAFNEGHAVKRLKSFLYPEFDEDSHLYKPHMSEWNNYAYKMRNELKIRKNVPCEERLIDKLGEVA